MPSLRKHAPFALLALALFAYLGAKAFKVESSSGWGVYSAMTMLSSENWVKDGFFKSRFLFIPIGHSGVVEHLDEPEMRQHARGTVTGGLIGKRLYYTHYPAGYLFPYALLMKAGVEGRHWHRALSLVFSFAALALMYCFVNAISTPAIALISALYYAASTMFMDFADSLANQPLDDLFRFSILLVSAAALGRADYRTGLARHNLLIWVLYFLLSSSSYDSTIFVFIWLVGLDLLTHYSRRGAGEAALPWAKWLLFASAPVLAFAVQMAQNWWYLGFNDMLLDIKGAFLMRAGKGEGLFGSLYAHAVGAFKPFQHAMNLRSAAVAVAAAIAALLFLLGKKAGRLRPDLRYVLLLALSGMAFTFVFNGMGKYDYEGRQLAPFAAILFASATVLSAALVRAGAAARFRGWTPPMAVGVAALLALLSLVWFRQGHRTAQYAREWPNHAIQRHNIDYYAALRSLSDNDAVIFLVNGAFDSDFPQPNPYMEYFTGKTVLCFKKPEDLVRDYRWLNGRAKRPFDAIIVSPDAKGLDVIAAALGRQSGATRRLTVMRSDADFAELFAEKALESSPASAGVGHAAQRHALVVEGGRDIRPGPGLNL